jgi:predicted HTH domain antitoxin
MFLGCEVLDHYLKKGFQEGHKAGALSAYVRLVKEGKITVDYAVKELDMDLKAFENLTKKMEDKGRLL